MALSNHRLWPPHAREVHGCFFDTIDPDKVIYLVIEEGAHGADAETGCSPGKIKVLPNMTGIHVDVPVGSLPVFPRAPRNNGRPHEGCLSLPDHVLPKGGIGEQFGEIAALDELHVEHTRPEMVHASFEPLDGPCEDVGLDGVERSGRGSGFEIPLSRRRGNALGGPEQTR